MRPDELRQEVADDFNITTKKAKEGFNAIIFGQRLTSFKHKMQIAGNRNSETMYNFAKEMGRLSAAIVNDQGGRQCRSEAACRTLLSRTVEKEEEKLMRALRTALEQDGWKVGSLIHDAIIVEKKNEARERETLYTATQNVLERVSEENGWGGGILTFKITPT